MSTIIGTIVAAAATAAAGVICMKVSKNRQRREAEKDVEKARERLMKAKEELRQAIHKKDDEAVNAALAKFFAGCLLAAALIGCKCESVVTYVPADRRVVSITNEWGVACKAVPDVVFAEMCDKLLDYEELKREKAVDKRLGQ